jgi:hypothetical protein
MVKKKEFSEFLKAKEIICDEKELDTFLRSNLKISIDSSGFIKKS